ncbi:pantothenate transporter protein [Colletotrichum tofieldiae]|nr:pantothenate transporter protein [Colletotrichum tofieldiae]GKT91021.1 pantothenate transporter protein [Colletotrichum tofieldiae]
MDRSSNNDGGKDAFSVVAQPNEQQPKRSLRKRIAAVVWDSLDKDPEERKFIAKIDWWILSYCCIAYFVKYLDQTNVR